MTSGTTAVLRSESIRLAGACAGLLVLAAALGSTVHLLRPAATRLPWVGDWKHHVENLAFKAGIPVTFLAGAQERAGDPATVVFDARMPEPYAAGHLPGALNLPVGEVDARIGAYAARLTPQTPILAYCDGADCTDGLDLAVKLRGLAFEDVTLYPGGYAEWVQYGGAVRKGEKP
ncbi:MAG: rhodanese-like domain-containing protein [Kiritimatiellia bacterium]